MARSNRKQRKQKKKSKNVPASQPQDLSSAHASNILSHRPKETPSANAPSSSTPASTTSPSEQGLFSLSGELRNQIYRLAVVRPDYIDLSSSQDRAEPGLLRVNKRIRHETTEIYWLENEFHFYVHNFDSTLITRFHRAFQHLVDLVDLRLVIHNSPNWTNLKFWLRSCYMGSTLDISHLETKAAYNILDFDVHFAMHLFRVVRRHRERGASWEEIELVLEEVREPVGLLNSAWDP